MRTRSPCSPRASDKMDQMETTQLSSFTQLCVWMFFPSCNILLHEMFSLQQPNCFGPKWFSGHFWRKKNAEDPLFSTLCFWLLASKHVLRSHTKRLADVTEKTDSCMVGGRNFPKQHEKRKVRKVKLFVGAKTVFSPTNLHIRSNPKNLVD